MKSFFKTALASFVGIFLAFVFIIFLLFGIIAVSVSSIGDKTTIIKEKSVLHIQLSDQLLERAPKNPFNGISPFSLEPNNQPGLDEILECIEKAAKDEKIKGIYLDIPVLSAGIANTEEIRNALIAFKKSGKFIYAFGDYYTQGSYYLASVSNKIFLNPEGAVLLNGMGTELMFFKGTLDKLEIEPQIIRHGKFKSAVEPFLLDKMSDENRRQIAGFIDPIWNHMCTRIAEARKLEAAQIGLMADSLLIRKAQDAVKYHLVDSLLYYDQFIALINKKTGTDVNESPEFVSLDDYKDAPNPLKDGKTYSRDKIAVIYAVGSISNGEGDDESIGSDDLAATIREARNDKKIKAIVLRVNSPGGDALASEEIWRETVLARKSKPVIVSMGDVAASGGYYISCAADKIVAQPNTITGSIGVFGLMFNAEKMLKNKLGITVDTYKTSPYQDMGSMTRSMTESERLIMQQEVDDVYNVFTGRVAAGRKLTKAFVDSIGQGRVWAGETALRIGLVDTLGGLKDAIAIAAKKAGLKDYKITSLPHQKEFFEEIMEDLSTEASLRLNSRYPAPLSDLGEEVNSILKMRGIQALMPYKVGFE